MQDVELACLLQDSRQQRIAVLRVEQVDDKRDHCDAVLVAERLQRCLVAVDHHHARACGQHRLGASQSDSRRSPGHDDNLAFQFSCHRSLSCSAAYRRTYVRAHMWLKCAWARSKLASSRGAIMRLKSRSGSPAPTPFLDGES